MNKNKYAKALALHREYGRRIPSDKRYMQIFVYRYGIDEARTHTQKETGQKFGISAGRAGALEARAFYELEKLIAPNTR